MAYPQAFSVSITTDASGDSTDYTEAVRGPIRAVVYLRGDAGDLATGTDFTITTEDTKQAVLTVTNAGTANVDWHPRLQVQDAADGSDLTLDGTRKMVDYVFAAGERIEVVTADGGNATSGTLTFIVG